MDVTYILKMSMIENLCHGYKMDIWLILSVSIIIYCSIYITRYIFILLKFINNFLFLFLSEN